MANKAKTDSNCYPSDRVPVRIFVTPEIKKKLMEGANERQTNVSDYCKPVIVALANGEIVSRVIDLREKK